MTAGNPLATAVELQRTVLEGSRRAASAGRDIRQAVDRSVADGIEAQQRFQRRMLGVQYAMVRQATRHTDERTPGARVTDEVLRTLDRQVAALGADRVTPLDTLAEAVTAAGATADGSLDLFDEQVAVALATLDTVERLSEHSRSADTHRPDGG